MNDWLYENLPKIGMYAAAIAASAVVLGVVFLIGYFIVTITWQNIKDSWVILTGGFVWSITYGLYLWWEQEHRFRTADKQDDQ